MQPPSAQPKRSAHSESQPQQRPGSGYTRCQRKRPPSPATTSPTVPSTAPPPPASAHPCRSAHQSPHTSAPPATPPTESTTSHRPAHSQSEPLQETKAPQASPPDR